MAEKNSIHHPWTTDRHDDDIDRAAIEERLNRLRQLGANWDSYDGSPPSETAINEARHVLSIVAAALAPESGRSVLPPVIAPMSDGGILLEWTAEYADLEVEISEAGHLSSLKTTRNADGEQYNECEDVTIDEIVRLVASTIGA